MLAIAENHTAQGAVEQLLAVIGGLMLAHHVHVYSLAVSLPYNVLLRRNVIIIQSASLCGDSKCLQLQVTYGMLALRGCWYASGHGSCT